MASSVNPLAGSSPTSSTGSSTASVLSGGAAPTEEMFLQLLVAQIQNQDPLNPTDSTQFVTQLAQFSELEQTIAMRGDLDTLASSATAPPAQTPPATTPTPATTPQPTQTTLN
jgi:flagellar basal-body rod modification protein FlgD